MGSLIRRLFDLRPGEGRLVLRSSATLFGLIAAHTILETARDTLFLGILPVSRLTFVYALLALLSLFVARANSRFVFTFGRRNGLIVTLLVSAFGTVLFYLLEPTQPVVFGLYLWSGLLGSVLIVQFWMLVGQAFTVSQGKRLFGLLASGGVLGAVSGASLSAGALEFVNVTDLLVVAAGIFLLTALFLTDQDIDEVPLEAPSSERTGSALSGAIRFVRDYPYLLRLGLLVGVSTAAVLSTDYLFKAVAAGTRTAEELGPFFAKYYAVLNSVALVVQLLVSSALVRRIGVIGAFLVLPSFLAVGGAASLAVGGMAVLFTKGADGALRHSLHRITSELLWMPLPDEVRARAKAIVDTVMVRGSQAVVAGILLVAATLGYDSPEYLAGLVLSLSVVWLVLGFGLRRPYIDLFRQALSNRTSGGRLELDLRSVEVVVESLSSRDPQEAIAAIDLLAASDRTRLIPALILYHESEEVLLRALEVLPIPERTDWVPLAERLLDNKSAAIRVAALEALARTGHSEVVQDRLLDISPWVRAHAAFWIAHKRDSAAPQEDPSIQLILQMPGTSGGTARVGLLEAITDSGDERWADLLLKLADGTEPDTAHAAVRAMTRIHDPRFIPILVRRLAVRNGRSLIREAIVALGEPAFKALESALDSDDTDPRIRVQVPATIARFADEQAAAVLMQALESVQEGRLRYKVLRALELLTAKTKIAVDRRTLERRMLHDLREHFRMAGLLHSVGLAAETSDIREGASFPESGELLKGLLADKRDQAMDRFFLLMQVNFPDEDLRSVRSAARSYDRRRRAQAQEFLDALASLSAHMPILRRLLRLAIDDLPPAERLARAEAELGETLICGPVRALQVLLQDSDAAVSALAAYYMLESGQEDLRAEVMEAASQEHSITESLRELLHGLSAVGEAPRLA